jgi:hypothetical protein
VGDEPNLLGRKTAKCQIQPRLGLDRRFEAVRRVEETESSNKECTKKVDCGRPTVPLIANGVCIWKSDMNPNPGK